MQITIDLKKINKNKLKDRTYTKDGIEVTVRELTLNVIPLSQERRRAVTGYDIVTTHFLAQPQTPEEKQQNIKTPGVGEVYEFEKNEANVTKAQDNGADLGL